MGEPMYNKFTDNARHRDHKWGNVARGKWGRGTGDQLCGGCARTPGVRNMEQALATQPHIAGWHSAVLHLAQPNVLGLMDICTPQGCWPLMPCLAVGWQGPNCAHHLLPSLPHHSPQASLN